MKPSTARTITAAILFVVVGVGLVINTGLGTPSSFGWDYIALICPLGAVETMLAQWVFLPQTLICLALVVALILIFGKVFCGWFCPIPLTRRIFGGKKAVAKDLSDLKEMPEDEAEAATWKENHADQKEKLPTQKENRTSRKEKHSCSGCNIDCSTTREELKLRVKNSPKDSRFWVLGAALVSTALFGFPIFCIVCPIGLSFATFIALWRLVAWPHEATITLIIFPLIILLEVFFLRKWCHRFCPLGAFISLISKGNKTLNPQVDGKTCLRTTEKSDCHACFDACPEGIDLHKKSTSAPLSECTKCRECVAACPTKSITFPLIPKTGKESSVVNVDHHRLG